MSAAVRVKRRGTGGGFVWHWLADPERTFCGRKPAELNVVEEADLEAVPAVEECGQCVRIRDHIKLTRVDRQSSSSGGAVHLSPSLGRVRKTGSLNHGTRVRRGSELR